MKRVVRKARVASVALMFLFSISPFLTRSEEIPLITAEFPPFNFKDPTTGKIGGFNTEIITEVFKTMELTPNISFSIFKRAYVNTRSGKYAAYFAMTKNPEREQDFYFSDPISSVQDVIFKHKTVSMTWETYEDLASYRLGYTDKYNYDKAFLATIRSKELMSGDNPEFRLLRMLALKRVDMVICEVSVCSYIIGRHPRELSKIDFINKPIGVPEPRPISPCILQKVAWSRATSR